MGREGWGLLLNSIKFGDREWQVYKVNDKSIKRRCRGDFFQEARFFVNLLKIQDKILIKFNLDTIELINK